MNRELKKEEIKNIILSNFATSTGVDLTDNMSATLTMDNSIFYAFDYNNYPVYIEYFDDDKPEYICNIIYKNNKISGFGDADLIVVIDHIKEKCKK